MSQSTQNYYNAKLVHHSIDQILMVKQWLNQTLFLFNYGDNETQQ
jgi:hypothetical protein